MKTERERNLLDTYSKELARLPDRLSKERAKKLFLKAKGDDLEARNRLVEDNLKLVIDIVRKHYWAKLDGNFINLFLDLIQAGNLGIFKALKKFKPEKGFEFSTYAKWWIREGIDEFLEDRKEFPISDEHAQTDLNRLIRLRDNYFQDNGRWLTAEELSELSEIPVKKVKTLLRASQTVVSLDKPIGEDNDKVLGNLIADESSIDQEEIAQKKELREDIIVSFSCLNPREEKTLRAHFGIGQDDGEGYDQNRTLTAIGEDFEIGRERTRQIEKEGLKKLRRRRGRLLKEHL